MFGIPLLGKYLVKFASKNHYALTKISEHHIVDIDDFRHNIEQLVEALRENAGKVCFIRIADAGETMVKKVYGIRKDIDNYNKVLMDSGALFLDPYKSTDVKKYILESDGHHLTRKGQEMVFNCVDSVIMSGLGISHLKLRGVEEQSCSLPGVLKMSYIIMISVCQAIPKMECNKMDNQGI